VVVFSRLKRIHINTTQNNRRGKEFYGEASGLFLAHWLNGPKETPWPIWRAEFLERFGIITGTSDSDAKARDRIAHLVRKLKQFIEMAGELYVDQDRPKNPKDWRLLSALCDSINSDLSHYPARPSIDINPPVKNKLGYFKPLFSHARAYRWAISPASDALVQEAMAVQLIQDAEKQGWLNQVRECRVCGRWFFARRREKRHCSTKCGKKEYQSSERYKEWRHRHYLNHEKRRRINKHTGPDPKRLK
jgi:hypothetical protein